MAGSSRVRMAHSPAGSGDDGPGSDWHCPFRRPVRCAGSVPALQSDSRGTWIGCARGSHSGRAADAAGPGCRRSSRRADGDRRPHLRLAAGAARPAGIRRRGRPADAKRVVSAGRNNATHRELRLGPDLQPHGGCRLAALRLRLRDPDIRCELRGSLGDDQRHGRGLRRDLRDACPGCRPRRPVHDRSQPGSFVSRGSRGRPGVARDPRREPAHSRCQRSGGLLGRRRKGASRVGGGDRDWNFGTVRAPGGAAGHHLRPGDRYRTARRSSPTPATATSACS